MIIRAFLVLLPMAACIVVAQQPAPQGSQPSAGPSVPIELPEYVVTGKDRVDIPGATKSDPMRPPVLGKARLDTLNSLEKLSPPILAPASLPVPRRTMAFLPGFLQAEFGQYGTPDVVAGYSLEASGYRIDAQANLETSAGHTTNASYTKAGLRALSTYVAPDKFIFFGGSTTEVDVSARTSSYRFFAVPDAAERTVTSLRAGLGVDGTYDGFDYTAQTGYVATATTLADRSARDGDLFGTVTAQNRWRLFDVGGRISMNLRSFNGNAYPAAELVGFGRYADERYRLLVQAGFQSVTSTAAVGRGGIVVAGTADVFLSHDVTINASLRTGLRPVGFADLLQENPYVHDSVLIDAALDVIDVGGMVTYHPSVRLAASAGLRLAQTDRTPIWVDASAGAFALTYAATTRVEVPVEVRWIAGSRDIIVADARLVSATVADQKNLPYAASRASIRYERLWTEALRSTLAAMYVGERFADLANTISLTGYVDVRVRVDYDVTPTLAVQVRAHNLLASEIILWNGYRERGVFVSGGVTWRF
ncbi:MAG: hypothetical protein MUC47_04485 [Candidatus Kapabacteria bacterium]|jgi:hypothetical protein|nr:hypothetical protein [Candidatus Kapabacteria bacterium]